MPTTAQIQEWNATWKFVRNILIFMIGMAGLAYEALLAHPVNQPLLVIFAGAVGLPAFMRIGIHGAEADIDG